MTEGTRRLPFDRLKTDDEPAWTGSTSVGHRSPRRDQRGLSESVQWAALGGAFLAAMLGLIEAGLVLHARSVAVQAALAGAGAQSAFQAVPNAGTLAASEVASLGGLTNVDITVTVSGGNVVVLVQGDAPAIIGWMTPHVQAESTRPMEGA